MKEEVQHHAPQQQAGQPPTGEEHLAVPQLRGGVELEDERVVDAVHAPGPGGEAVEVEVEEEESQRADRSARGGGCGR